jgi:hypothetical protein
MSESNDAPVYVATDKFLEELRELGYPSNIELEDLIEFLEEDPSYIEQMQPTIWVMDEISFLSPGLAKWLHHRTIDNRPT